MGLSTSTELATCLQLLVVDVSSCAGILDSDEQKTGSLALVNAGGVIGRSDREILQQLQVELQLELRVCVFRHDNTAIIQAVLRHAIIAISSSSPNFTAESSVFGSPEMTSMEPGPKCCCLQRRHQIEPRARKTRAFHSMLLSVAPNCFSLASIGGEAMLYRPCKVCFMCVEYLKPAIATP